MLKLIERVTGGVVIAIAAVLLLQVVGRHVLAYPFAWPEELAGFLFVWLVFLGAVVAYRSGGLIGIHVFVDLLPPRGRAAVRLLANLIVDLVLAGLVWQGVRAATAAAGTRTTVLQFSWAWIYAALPLGCAALLVAMLATTIQSARHLADPSRHPDPIAPTDADGADPP